MSRRSFADASAAGLLIVPFEGTAFIGYDSINTCFCVAAYLKNESSANAGCTVVEDREETFVQVGNTKKLTNITNGVKFAYVKYTDGVNSTNRTIGE